jgi:hypothetical protein
LRDLETRTRDLYEGVGRVSGALRWFKKGELINSAVVKVTPRERQSCSLSLGGPIVVVLKSELVD